MVKTYNSPVNKYLNKISKYILSDKSKSGGDIDILDSNFLVLREIFLKNKNI